MGVDARRAAVERFQISCEQDRLIVAAFLGGSLAAGTADEVSDVDLYAVTREEDYAEFFARREAFIRSWDGLVFIADTLNFEGFGFDMVHFVLADGVHGELALTHTGNVRQLHGGPHEVLVDKAGLLEGVTFPLHVPSQPELRRQVQHALSWFWLDFIQLGKRATRGDLVAASLQLARMRSHCTVLMQAARSAGLDTDIDSLRNRLASTVPVREFKDVWTAAFAITEIHRTIGTSLAESLALTYPAELAAVALHKFPR